MGIKKKNIPTEILFCVPCACVRVVASSFFSGERFSSPASSHHQQGITPCFLRAASAGDGARSGLMGLDFDDSGDVFSMGRVGYGWLEASQMSKSRKDNSDTTSADDPDANSGLFKISLRDSTYGERDRWFTRQTGISGSNGDSDTCGGIATCWFCNGKTFVNALFGKKDEEKNGSPSRGKSEILESFDMPSTPILSFDYK
ncbi:hypothetical protein GUJ93_ZPchr0015g6936 [Zizania palustris]|uniref:Uncharacterized protein n=1 Tax=Zizania palustris TaxID=103762 RepID=A0A8J5SYU3_ZIZPA|nr:hypothetical protein GUJ93_ZPchr0015g6936 [Zizania palustris]